MHLKNQQALKYPQYFSHKYKLLSLPPIFLLENFSVSISVPLIPIPKICRVLIEEMSKLIKIKKWENIY